MAPTFPAVSLTSLKRHSNISFADDDLSFLEYLDAATDFIQDQQERCLRQSTWQAVFDEFPSCGGYGSGPAVFYLPLPPLVSVTSIAYVDTTGATQTLSPSTYVVDTAAQPGRIALASQQIWPDTICQIAAVTITFVAGYASEDLIPAQTRQAIRHLTSHWYEQREPIVVGMSVANVPFSVMDLIEKGRFVTYR